MAMEQMRKELLTVLGCKNPGDDAWSREVLQLVARDGAKDDDFTLEEFLQTVADKDQVKIWEGLASRLGPVLELVTAAEEEEEEEGEADQERLDDDGEVASPKRSKKAGGRNEEEIWQAFRLLSAVMALAQATLQVRPPAGKNSSSSSSSSALPEGLLQVMIALHDVLFQLWGLEGEALQGGIARVCEQWWKEERGGAEFLVAQTVPYLVAKSLEEDAKEVSVKRVYAMRGALLLLDYEEEATGPFRQLLLQCFLKPTYLRSADGRRLLTYLFGLHPALVADIHETVRSQLPYAKKKLVQAYGDVYFRAWKAASSPYLEAIETGCIQDFMHAAVHSSSPSLYVTLRLFLQAFHTNKRLRDVDAMLLRLYNPILWRSLQVASPTVRAQATGLLVDAFPLQNPDMGTIEAASLLQKQLDMLQALLLDPEPHVRVAAVVGVCRVLSVFWEAIPLHVTKQYITRLVGSLAFDSSSALVRLAVVEGLTELLEQPLAHPVLKQALPLTAPLLQDKTPRVRLAFVGLLQKVKAVRDIKFYQVVPVEHLLARFAVDAPKASSKALSARMADLLLNSYFPQGAGVTGSKQVSRCLTFLSQSKPAALAFYGRLRDHVGLGSVTRLTAMLLKCVFAALADQQAAAEARKEGGGGAGGQEGKGRKRKGVTVRLEKKRGREAMAVVDGMEEGEDRGDGAAAAAAEEEKKRMSEVDEATLSGMLEVISVMWTRIAPELSLPANQPAADLLHQTLESEDMSTLYDKLADPTSLLQLAALCPEIFAGALGGAMIKDLKEGVGREADLRAGPIAALLCAWGKTKEVVEMVCTGLGGGREGGEEENDSSSSKRKRGGKNLGGKKGGLGVELGDVGRLTPTRALAMLSHLLNGQGEAASRARGLLLEEEERAATAAVAGGVEEDGDGVREGPISRALLGLKERVDERLCGEMRVEGVGEEGRAVLVGGLEVWLRWQLHVFGQAALAAAEATGVPLLLPKAMLSSLAWVEETLLPTALQMDSPSLPFSSSSDFEQVGPLSPPVRRPRTTTTITTTSSSSNRNEQEKEAKTTFALELFAASMMVVSDWIVVLPDAAVEVTKKAQLWSTHFFLPGLAEERGDNEGEDEAKNRRCATLTLLPQLCRLAYQLGLQETRQQQQGSQQQQEEEGRIALPPSLVEVLVRAVDFKGEEMPWHRYQDTHVDSYRCLAGLLGLYGRVRSTRPALTSLVNRLTSLCVQELEEGRKEEGEPSARARALCAVLVRATPALTVAVSQTLADLKATVGEVATAAAASSVEEGMVNDVDTTKEEVQVTLRARLLSVLFESAAEKARKTLLPKVVRSLDATLEGAKEAAPASEGVVQIANTIEALGENLQRLAVESS
ncbi:heat repeat domain containing protein [Nannochloropsis oceanica]